MVEPAAPHQSSRSSRTRVPNSRQAVVVIHGMGEQRPMATLRAMVENLWQNNPLVKLATTISDKPSALMKEQVLSERADAGTDEFEKQTGEKAAGKSYWVAPSPFLGDADDTHELMKLTTAKHIRFSQENNRAGLVPGKARTDFFEFYWADILSGTKFNMIMPWLRTLVFRLPWKVPNKAFSIWALIWLIILFAFVCIVFVIASGFALLADDPFGFLPWIRPFIEGQFFQWLVKPIGTVLVLIVVAWYLATWITLLAAFANKMLSLRRRLTELAAGLLFTLLVATVGMALFMWADPFGNIYQPSVLPGDVEIVGPTQVDITPDLYILSMAAIAFLMFVHQIMNGLFVPYFGDVALYVRSTPETVEKRRRIRHRGLTLLRKLHDDPSYDRVVIVAHSLGSIIAYDLVRLLWAEYGPGSRNPGLSKSTKLAMDKVAEFSFEQSQTDDKRPWPDDGAYRTYRKLQKQVFWSLQNDYRKKQAAGEEARPWKISDFVTIGSPLAHAEFLLADNLVTLQSRLVDRTWPSCPPEPEKRPEPDCEFNPEEHGFTYQTESYDAETGQVHLLDAAHHASAFAAVRWTNIYDWRSMLALGDVASGPLYPIFGKGVYEVHVKMARYSPFMFFNRIMTHNDYWTWKDDAGRQVTYSGLAGEKIAMAGEGIPPHLHALQAAVDLSFGRDQLTRIGRGKLPDPDHGRMPQVVFLVVLGIFAGWLGVTTISNFLAFIG